MILMVNRTKSWGARQDGRRWEMKFPSLFKGKEDAAGRSMEGTQLPDETCPHKLLVPRWDSVDDMGDESKATGYKCDACGASLSLMEVEEARRQRHSIAL
jgi:hypothetical protein